MLRKRDSTESFDESMIDTLEEKASKRSSEKRFPSGKKKFNTEEESIKETLVSVRSSHDDNDEN